MLLSSRTGIEMENEPTEAKKSNFRFFVATPLQTHWTYN